ncbi:MAG: hypothetical protein AAGG75_23470 [Bacteroidota bacterium]
MKSITFNSSEDRFVISIDKKVISKETLLQFVDNLRLEFLAQKVDFDEAIEELGEEIKGTWWEDNKDRFIPKEEQ